LCPPAAYPRPHRSWWAKACKAVRSRWIGAAPLPTLQGLRIRRQREAVVQPGQAAEYVVGRPLRGGGGVAYVAGDAFGVVERPHRARFKLHAGGARQPRDFVAAEGGGVVSTLRVDQFRDTDRILNRHAGALRERLQRR